LDGLNPQQPASAADLTAAIRYLAARAHQLGVRIYVATLVPFEGRPDDYYSTEKNKVHQEVNEWIRTAKDIDAICDFDHALADPARPNRMNPEFDFLGHANDAGQRALSEAVNLSLFK
jgi:hypothetical protein